MENPTCFDLNAALETWRNDLAAQPDVAVDDRRELETHLRDTISELQRRGLNEEESFWLACRRTGRAQQLNEEFVKANPTRVWRERVFWMVLAYLVISLWHSTVSYTMNVLYSSLNRSTLFPWLAGGFILLVDWLPVIAGAIWLAKGQLAPGFQKWLV